MPALSPQIMQRMAEASVIVQRQVAQHEIVEAFLVGELLSRVLKAT